MMEHYEKSNKPKDDFVSTTEKMKKAKESGEWQPINPGNFK